MRYLRKRVQSSDLFQIVIFKYAKQAQITL